MPLPAARKANTMVGSAEFFLFLTSFMIAGQVAEKGPAKMPYVMQKRNRGASLIEKPQIKKMAMVLPMVEMKMQVVAG